MIKLYEKIPKEILNNLPIKNFEGDIFFIDNIAAVEKTIPELKKSEILGFDTETRPAFKKGIVYKVSLLQLATADKAFLFKIKKTGLPDKLIQILSDKNIIKAGVAIHDDIKALRRIRNFTPEGFTELQTFSDNFGIKDNGLKKLAGNILGFRISKSARLTDWSKDNYTEAQLKYAATDAWTSYKIYKKLTELNGNYKIIENET